MKKTGIPHSHFRLRSASHSDRRRRESNSIDGDSIKAVFRVKGPVDGRREGIARKGFFDEFNDTDLLGALEGVGVTETRDKDDGKILHGF